MFSNASSYKVPVRHLQPLRMIRRNGANTRRRRPRKLGAISQQVAQGPVRRPRRLMLAVQYTGEHHAALTQFNLKDRTSK